MKHKSLLEDFSSIKILSKISIFLLNNDLGIFDFPLDNKYISLIMRPRSKV